VNLMQAMGMLFLRNDDNLNANYMLFYISTTYLISVCFWCIYTYIYLLSCTIWSQYALYIPTPPSHTARKLANRGPIFARLWKYSIPVCFLIHLGGMCLESCFLVLSEVTCLESRSIVVT
jgi:hypothetical protein